MKYLLLLSLFISSAFAGECKLTGITQSCQKYETKFELGNIESCTDLAKKTKDNKFFNFIEQNDELVKTEVSFKEELTQKEEVKFIEGDCV